MKKPQPLPHGVLDYAWGFTMMAAPWLFGFHKNKKAKLCSVLTGGAIIDLSLMTRYPLGAVKLIPFPAHGVIETLSGVATAAAPWLMGFAGNRRARLTHVIAGIGTLGVVAMTDYKAAEPRGSQSAVGTGAGEPASFEESAGRMGAQIRDRRSSSSMVM